MPLAVDPDGSPGLDDRLSAAARCHELGDALDELPPAQRDAVQMRVVDELGYPELAERLDCTEAAARKRVSLGLRFLRGRLEATR